MKTARPFVGWFGNGHALVIAWRGMGQSTLRITMQETNVAVEIKLEGRIAGPWAAELGRVWVETAPLLASRELVLDLRNVTYADTGGRRVLADVYSHTRARLITSTPWTQHLAEEIMGEQAVGTDEEAGDANKA